LSDTSLCQTVEPSKVARPITKLATAISVVIVPSVPVTKGGWFIEANTRLYKATATKRASVSNRHPRASRFGASHTPRRVTFSTKNASKAGNTRCEIIRAMCRCTPVGSCCQPIAVRKEPDRFGHPPVTPLMTTPSGKAIANNIQLGREAFGGEELKGRIEGLQRDLLKQRAAGKAAQCRNHKSHGNLYIVYEALITSDTFQKNKQA